MTSKQHEAHDLLWKCAVRPTGQGSVVARFLLTLYNGFEHKFDLTDLRGLDRDLANACMEVLAVEIQAQQEIHGRMGMTEAEFYQPLARTTGLT